MGLIPPSFLDCVVAIGIPSSKKGKFQGIASGFLYGDFVRKLDNEKNEYRIFLVTNRHVFKDLAKVTLRFNPQNIEESALDYNFDLIDQNGKKLWVEHPSSDVDVAVSQINYNLFEKQKIKCAYFQSDWSVANIQKLNDLGIMEGDFVYTLGFPMGIVGEKRNVVIVRSGTIARIRDTLEKQNNEYLIDSAIFPGNSGGPVISKPEITHITGTKSQKSSYLIGIVKEYVTYSDVAISQQTKKPRIIFEENSGLAVVHPIDYIQEIILNFDAWKEGK